MLAAGSYLYMSWVVFVHSPIKVMERKCCLYGLLSRKLEDLDSGQCTLIGNLNVANATVQRDLNYIILYCISTLYNRLGIFLTEKSLRDKINSIEC